MMQQMTRMENARSWILAGIFFCIPLSIAPAYQLSAILLMLTLAEGRYAEKLRKLRDEPLFWIFLAYFLIFVVSLLWSEDMDWGMRMVRRQMFFLLFPLYLLAARREHLTRYIGAFLLSIGLCEVLAYYNFAQMYYWPALPEGIKVDKDHADTAPFVDRIMFAPALALAGYLAAHQLFLARTSARMKVVYAVLLVATAINLLFSGGRAGLVGFLVLMVLCAIQRFARRPVLAALLAGSAAMLFLTVGYLSNDYFRSRVDIGVADIQTFEQNPNTSLGQRATFLMHASRMFMDSPLLGIGVGDYPDEYEKLNQKYTPQLAPQWNPHNQYLYALTAAGIPGGILLLLVLLVPLARRCEADGWQYLRRAVPVLLLTICLVESYLLRSNTSLMYVVFTAALWSGARRATA